MAIVKLLHVLFVFTWIGSLLVLTRFLAYRAREELSVQTRLTSMIRRLYLAVELPSMIIAILTGIILLYCKPVTIFRQGWLHMKLTFVVLLVGVDLVTGSMIRKTPAKAWPFRALHAAAALFFVAVLVAIYILKAKVAS